MYRNYCIAFLVGIYDRYIAIGNSASGLAARNGAVICIIFFGSVRLVSITIAFIDSFSCIIFTTISVLMQSGYGETVNFPLRVKYIRHYGTIICRPLCTGPISYTRTVWLRVPASEGVAGFFEAKFGRSFDGKCFVLLLFETRHFTGSRIWIIRVWGFINALAPFGGDCHRIATIRNIWQENHDDITRIVNATIHIPANKVLPFWNFVRFW